MLDNITVFHSSIKIVGSQTIYFDPYNIDSEYEDADIVFITHDHFDHYSKDDLSKVIKDTSFIVAPICMKHIVERDFYELCNLVFVEPNSSSNVNNISFEAIPSYNVGKQFHPIEKGYVGYIVNMDETTYFVAGDTDINEDNQKVKCDVAFLPCGGHYTMDASEAATLANTIKPQFAVPTHYGSVAGSKEDGKTFVSLLNDGITGIIKIK